ncbi:MAG TPA: DUF4190 domain-containing protein [Polyangiaceae bacterium]|nr:DUF4190 domain-containing protein [Polyangiaceae bacterium]
MTPAGLAPKTNTTAILAVFAGLFGSCFCGLGGVLAIVLGLAARGEIARASGRESGSGLATAGIVLGGINLALVVLGVAVSIAMVARPAAIAALAPPPTPPFAGVAPAPSTPAVPAPNPARAPFTREQGTRETSFGKIRVVDPSPGAVSLRTALAEQQKAARAEKETLVVFVVAPNCLPCNGVMLSLRDPRMQTALAGVRLVRLDASEFGAELLSLGVPTETVPGFALLSESLRPTDYVHGGEWDADVPANISPVLGPFVRGKYTARRHRYREAARPDETAL